jgi:hypothetical protein
MKETPEHTTPSVESPVDLDSTAKPELNVDEFSIVELEDRLEFLERCDSNCSCPPPPKI